MFEEVDEPSAGRGRSVTDLLARAGLGGVPRSALVGVAVLVGLAIGIAGWRVASDSSGVEFSYENGAARTNNEAEGDVSSAVQEREAGTETSEITSLWVHVAGAVRLPGLYELPPDARVGAAVSAAGGVTEGAVLDAVNLARALSDGEQVYVPTAEEVAAGRVPVAEAAAKGVPAGEGAAGGGIDINLASGAELQALPGVGAATADKIVADREANGPFSAPEDIMRVAGIGEKKFEAMRDLIVVR